jgi:GNAT superfamily N-acetyltransferase
MTDVIPLTVDAIHQAIQSCCRRFDTTESPWSFCAAKTIDFQQEQARIDSPTRSISLDESLLFGFVASRKSSGGSDIAACSLLTTFHMGYFTWTGRAICLDELGGIGGADVTRTDEGSLQELSYLRVQLLAAIAVELSCRRLVWRHYGPPLVLPKKLKDTNTTTIEPETMPGWWTMYWDLERLKAFAGDQSPSICSVETSRSIQDIFKSAIEQMPHAHGSFRLRLATADDVKDIDRLVHGLAVFEKEPDAVDTTLDQFRVDGFEELALYHCILVDYIEKEEGTKKPHQHTCAMAFCFMGFHLKRGRFIYLEDLFFEEAYRGKGGGTLVMQTLATVAQSLGCTKVVWQALDWNTPALDFYKKIGAKVQEGLVVSRFVGGKLQEFASQLLFPLMEMLKRPAPSVQIYIKTTGAHQGSLSLCSNATAVLVPKALSNVPKSQQPLLL